MFSPSSVMRAGRESGILIGMVCLHSNKKVDSCVFCIELYAVRAVKSRLISVTLYNIKKSHKWLKKELTRESEDGIITKHPTQGLFFRRNFFKNEENKA